MSDDIEPAGRDRTPLPFEDLAVPEPLTADPPAGARLAAFGSILLGGVLGALVGYGVGDVMFRDGTWAAVGALAGALTGAVGVGVVANLTLRAMGEWNAVQHPEDERPTGRRRDRGWSRRSGDQTTSRRSGDPGTGRGTDDSSGRRPAGDGPTDGGDSPGGERPAPEGEG